MRAKSPANDPTSISSEIEEATFSEDRIFLLADSKHQKGLGVLALLQGEPLTRIKLHAVWPGIEPCNEVHHWHLFPSDTVLAI